MILHKFFTRLPGTSRLVIFCVSTVFYSLRTDWKNNRYNVVTGRYSNLLLPSECTPIYSYTVPVYKIVTQKKIFHSKISFVPDVYSVESHSKDNVPYELAVCALNTKNDKTKTVTKWNTDQCWRKWKNVFVSSNEYWVRSMYYNMYIVRVRRRTYLHYSKNGGWASFLSFIFFSLTRLFVKRIRVRR